MEQSTPQERENGGKVDCCRLLLSSA